MPCGDCPDPAPRPTSIEATVLKGTVGLVKAACQLIGLPLDRASDQLRQARRDVCRTCDFAERDPSRLDRPTRGLTTWSQCKKCGCLIAAKTAIKSETCPEQLWPGEEKAADSNGPQRPFNPHSEQL